MATFIATFNIAHNYPVTTHAPPGRLLYLRATPYQTLADFKGPFRDVGGKAPVRQRTGHDAPGWTHTCRCGSR